MKDKKGLSAVIGTILIILLVLVAVVIIYAIVGPMITGAGESTQLNAECTKALLGSWSITEATDTSNRINVSRGSDDANVVAIVFYADGVKLGESSTVPTTNAIQLYQGSGTIGGDIAKDQIVEIAPKVQLLGKQSTKICDRIARAVVL